MNRSVVTIGVLAAFLVGKEIQECPPDVFASAADSRGLGLLRKFT
jgi:hypothetical protein